ncbi:hypothetical protein BV898_03131 [Hypsibius exemplaris]|nr:hypothetical protein BV898_03131 [Hypsibius exemplaris]
MTIHRPLRKSSSCPLIAQCIAVDLYITTVAVPIVVIPFFLGPSLQLSEDFCRYEALSVYLFYSCGMFSEAVVAFHRLIATVLPHHFVFFKRRSSVIGLLLISWVVAAVTCTFPTLGIGTRVVPATRGCNVAPQGNPASLTVSVAIGYFFPTIFMGCCYVTVLTRTSQELRKRQGKSRSLVRRMEISRTLFFSFLWHCVTVYPPLIVMGHFSEQYAESLSLKLAIMWLGSCFSAINPVSGIRNSSRSNQDLAV